MTYQLPNIFLCQFSGNIRVSKVHQTFLKVYLFYFFLEQCLTALFCWLVIFSYCIMNIRKRQKNKKVSGSIRCESNWMLQSHQSPPSCREMDNNNNYYCCLDQDMRKKVPKLCCFPSKILILCFSLRAAFDHVVSYSKCKRDSLIIVHPYVDSSRESPEVEVLSLSHNHTCQRPLDPVDDCRGLLLLFCFPQSVQLKKQHQWLLYYIILFYIFRTLS